MNQKFEGEYRATHIRVIVHAEAIALYDGQRREHALANTRFARVFKTNTRYYKWQAMLMFLRLLCTISQPSLGFLALALSGATNVSYAAAFLKQMGDCLEYSLYFPAIVARLAFASGATENSLCAVVHQS